VNAEQQAYVTWVIDHRNDTLFEEFSKAANLHSRLTRFESVIQAAWEKFLHERGLKPAAVRKQEQYKPMELEDFGRDDPAKPLPAQKAGTLDDAAKAAPVQSPTTAQTPPAEAVSGMPFTNGATLAPSSVPAPASTDSNAPAPTTVSASAPPPAALPTVPDFPKTPTPPAAAAPPPPAMRFTIRNARQNEPYDQAIQREPNVPGVRLQDVTLPANTGLKVDLENWRISGTPAIAGEFTLGLRYALSSQPAEVSHTAALTFVINADPKTLWRDNPSDRSAPFWKEDSASSVCLGRQAKMIAARQRGRAHAHMGTICDDDYLLHCDDMNGWHLAVVADGAGSAKFSRRGSQVATRAVGSYLKEVFSDQRGASLAEAIEAFAQGSVAGVSQEELTVLQQKTRNELFTTLGYAAHHAVRELQAEAKNRSDIIASAKELSTTLLIGIARKVGVQWFCAAYWVGDGAVAVYRRNRSVHLLGTPDSGEFSGQTHFLDASQVSQDALVRRLRFELVDDMTAFLLMTDGVSDPKFSSEAAMGQVAAWDQLWDDLEASVRLSSDDEGHETRLLEWLDFWAQGEYDDRTVAIIY